MAPTTYTTTVETTFTPTIRNTIVRIMAIMPTVIRKVFMRTVLLFMAIRSNFEPTSEGCFGKTYCGIGIIYEHGSVLAYFWLCTI